MAKRQKKFTGMYEVLDALRGALESAEPTKRRALSDTLNAYAKDFPDEYFWAIGPQAPVLLHHLMHEIDDPTLCDACREKAGEVPKRSGTPTLGEIGRNLNG